MVTGLYRVVENRQLGDSQPPEDEVRKITPTLIMPQTWELNVRVVR